MDTSARELSEGIAKEMGVTWVDGEPGRCFRNAFLFTRENFGWVIVHGAVFSPLTNKPMVHAWVERTVTNSGRTSFVALDPSQSPKSGWYRLIVSAQWFHQIFKVSYHKRYSLAEAEAKGERTETYGPWDRHLKKVRAFED